MALANLRCVTQRTPVAGGMVVDEATTVADADTDCALTHLLTTLHTVSTTLLDIVADALFSVSWFCHFSPFWSFVPKMPSIPKVVYENLASSKTASDFDQICFSPQEGQRTVLVARTLVGLSKLDLLIAIPVGTSFNVLGHFIMTLGMKHLSV